MTASISFRVLVGGRCSLALFKIMVARAMSNLFGLMFSPCLPLRRPPCSLTSINNIHDSSQTFLPAPIRDLLEGLSR
jgi:hypothetical protein